MLLADFAHRYDSGQLLFVVDEEDVWGGAADPGARSLGGFSNFCEVFFKGIVANYQVVVNGLCHVGSDPYTNLRVLPPNTDRLVLLSVAI